MTEVDSHMWMLRESLWESIFVEFAAQMAVVQLLSQTVVSVRRQFDLICICL